MLEPFQYTMPTRIVFGPGAIAKIGEQLEGWGCQKAILVTDPGVSALPFFLKVKEVVAKANLQHEVFDQVPRDPDLADVDGLVRLARDKGCDSVVAVGGGSALCAGRGLAVTLPGGTGSRDLVGVGKIKDEPLPVIAVPTTAGSGSEVSGVIVLSDRERGAIVTISSPFCFPRLAMLDPETLADLPPRQAMISGVDALAHGLEALMTTTPNPISEALAVHACGVIFNDLRRAVSTREAEPKARCLVASTMANMACGNARLSLCHAMTLPLSARFDIPHGVAAGLLLPHVLRFNLPVAGGRLIPLLMAMGCGSDGDPEAILQKLESLLQDLDFPTDLKTLGVKASALEDLAEEVVNSPLAKFNLRRAEKGHVTAIYEAAYTTAG
jgi:alcohol dehydrogenase